MASSLKPAERPIDLIESANRCKEHLDSLRKHASDGKTKHNSGKKKVLLEDVITRVNSNIQALGAWTAAIHRGRQTLNEEIKASVNAVFDNIVSRVHDAKKALNHRLGFSILNKSKFVMLQGCISRFELTLEQGRRRCTSLEGIG